MHEQRIIGPFRQMLSMTGLPDRGPIKDADLEIVREVGILTEGDKILETGSYEELKKKYPAAEASELKGDLVALPGLIDAHTHLCFAGSRAMDFAERNAGTSYQEIAAAGGGIWSSVSHTRQAESAELVELMHQRMDRLLQSGVTTVEIKSGYGLNVEQELRLLRSIHEAERHHSIHVIPTCLAAHMVPKDFNGSESDYLDLLLNELVPAIAEENLCTRFDIFIEENAFSVKESTRYLNALKEKGFEFTVHGDQFTTGGSQVAIATGALSVDHLEASTEREIIALSKSNVVPVALPGATLGLGCAFAPARKLLDAGCSLAIASDWNPGSAPMGDLLTQASILAAAEKLSSAEVWSGLTFRAARALGLSDRGRLSAGKMADIVAFPGSDYREILYHQGMLRPSITWVGGKKESK